MSMQITNNISSTNEQSEKKTKENENKKTSFSNELERSREKEEEVQNKENIKKLLEDVLSVIKTGLTVSELQSLQEMLYEINSLKNKNNPNNDKEISKLLSSLESAVLELQKKLKGLVVHKQDENQKKTANNNSIELRIENITKDINNILAKNIQNDEILNELFMSNDYTMLLKTGESEFSTKEEFSMMIDSIGKLRKNSDTKVKEENLIVELKQTLVKIEESITKKKNTTTDEELKLLEKIKNN